MAIFHSPVWVFFCSFLSHWLPFMWNKRSHTCVLNNLFNIVMSHRKPSQIMHAHINIYCVVVKLLHSVSNRNNVCLCAYGLAYLFGFRCEHYGYCCSFFQASAHCSRSRPAIRHSLWSLFCLRFAERWQCWGARECDFVLDGRFERNDDGNKEWECDRYGK